MLPGRASRSFLSWVPSPICLGSVSPSPYKVALRKSPREPRTGTSNSGPARQTPRHSRLDSPDASSMRLRADPPPGRYRTAPPGLPGSSERSEQERFSLPWTRGCPSSHTLNLVEFGHCPSRADGGFWTTRVACLDQPLRKSWPTNDILIRSQRRTT
jgi:hypothetical protein